MDGVSIHPSAIVDDGAEIGAGSRVWHFVHVCSGARIGSGVSLGQGVFVGNRVRIGDGCKVQNNVSIYDNVTLEDGVFCGPSMVFTNVINPRAKVERKSEYLDTLVREGEVLAAVFTSGNRDEDVFADPERFDLKRRKKDLLTFGRGPHMCPGAPLARRREAL